MYLFFSDLKAQSAVSQYSLEIILIWWFGAQGTFPIIISVENSHVAYYFCGKNKINSELFY